MSGGRWTAAQRVSRNNPCPVCDKRDWCGFSSDGHFIFCQRTETWGGVLALRQTDAGWMFPLDEQRPPELLQPPSSEPEIVRLPPLSREMLDCIYRELAALAGLKEEARQDIVTRRRFPAALETGIYFSLPGSGKQNEEISEALIARYGLDVIERVPGFTFLCKACSSTGITRDTRCRSCSGLGKTKPRFRSVRGERHDYAVIGCDEYGRAFWGYSRRLPFVKGQHRTKYMLLSSSRAGEPSVAGLPKYHVAGRQYPVDEPLVTEGVIKAEITAWRLQQRVIGTYSTTVDDPTLSEALRVIRGWAECAS